MTELKRLLTSVAQLESQVPVLSDGKKAQAGRMKAEGTMGRALTKLSSSGLDLEDEMAMEEVDLTEGNGAEGSNPTEVPVTPTFKRMKMDEEEPGNPPPRPPRGNQTAALVSYLKDKAKVNLLTHFMNVLLNYLI